MINILIIGGTGFIGRHLIKRLKKKHQKYNITYFVRKTSKTPLLKDEKLIYGDISEKQDIIKATKNIDIVINLAAPTTQIKSLNQKIIVQEQKT